MIRQEILEHSPKLSYYTQYIKRKWLILLFLVLAVFIMSVVSINAGSSYINPWEVIKTIFGFGSRNSRRILSTFPE